jgi:Cu/Ag efflux protein CusF
MKRLLRSLSAFAVLVLAVSWCSAQTAPAKKSYTFHGKVVSVDKSAKTLTIDGEKVEGWMAAMTMNYKVDDPSIVDKLKPGDQITATVYDGDYVLHNVKAVPAAKDAKSKK